MISLVWSNNKLLSLYQYVDIGPAATRSAGPTPVPMIIIWVRQSKFPNLGALVGYTPQISPNILSVESTHWRWETKQACGQQCDQCRSVEGHITGNWQLWKHVTCTTVMCVSEVDVNWECGLGSTCHVGMWQTGNMCHAEVMSQARHIYDEGWHRLLLVAGESHVHLCDT